MKSEFAQFFKDDSNTDKCEETMEVKYEHSNYIMGSIAQKIKHKEGDARLHLPPFIFH